MLVALKLVVNHTSTVIKINALENALGITTQDETVDQAIDRVINNLTTDEKRGYDLWLEMFKKKDSIGRL